MSDSLGPCFKTGELEAFRQHHETAAPEGLKERPTILSQSRDIGKVTILAFIPPA